MGKLKDSKLSAKENILKATIEITGETKDENLRYTPINNDLILLLFSFRYLD